ncbi:MAG TPA: thrombospondin type 3 repeat-containing protein [Candidatus Thermoplasmatota archaeon]|nr:thrombospondin type 3 repeat-containing protein [Candidatus Thermoplasmatota archaeon]
MGDPDAADPGHFPACLNAGAPGLDALCDDLGDPDAADPDHFPACVNAGVPDVGDPPTIDECDPEGPAHDVLVTAKVCTEPTPPDSPPSLVSMKVYPHSVRSKEAVALRATVDFVVVATDDLDFTTLRLLDGDTVLATNDTGAAKTKVVTFIVDTKLLEERPHDFKAVVRDSSGKEDSLVRTLRVDNTPPAKPRITLGSQPTGQNGWYVNNVQVALASAGDAQGATHLGYSLNGRAPREYTGAFSLGGQGLTNFTAIATDEAGNFVTTIQMIKLDTFDPVVAFVARPVSVTDATNVTIRMNATAVPSASAQVLVDGVAHTAVREGNSTVFKLVLQLTAANAHKTLKYQGVVKDEAGREGKSETVSLKVGDVPVGPDKPATQPDTDSDGDGLTDLEEQALGTDPRDIYSPPFKASLPTVERIASNGTMKLTWTAGTQARIDRFLVFRFSDPVLAGEVAFKPGQSTYTFYDEKFPGGKHTYAIQTKLATDPLKTFTVTKASPNSAPMTAEPASGVIKVVEPKVVDALKEPYFYIGIALLLGILAVMVTGIVRRRDAAQAPVGTSDN